MSKKLKIATVFSGIGAIEQALMKLKLNFKICFACDNGERELPYSYKEIIDFCKEKSIKNINQYVKELYKEKCGINHVKQSYFANYDISEKSWFEDIRFIDGNKFTNKIDLFVGGSPCQSFSIIGKRCGLEDTRGTLFYDFARLVKEIQPKVFIYENVTVMLSHDKGNTWSIISSIFDLLNYKWNLYLLNSKDFGIPQSRKRIYVVGFRNDLNIDGKLNIPKIELTNCVSDFLENKVIDKYYYGKKGFEWVTSPKNLVKRVSINSEIARTEAANQQFNWCGDMRFEKLSNRQFPDKVHIGQYNGQYGVMRKLTPRECLRLMGFSDNFKIVVSDTHIYRQSGNSIVVNVLESIVKEIIKTNVFK